MMTRTGVSSGERIRRKVGEREERREGSSRMMKEKADEGEGR